MNLRHFAMAPLLTLSLCSAASSQEAASQPVSQVRQSMRALWKVHTEPPTEEPRSLAMEQAINQVQTMKLSVRPRQAESAVATAVAEESASQPTSVPSTAPASQPASMPATQPAEAEALRLVAQLKAGSGEPHELQQMADVLFSSEHYAPAGDLYEFVLAKADPEQDKAWILFQIANCRRRTDTAAARVAYRRVVSECPKTTWAELAGEQDKLLEWMDANKPHDMLRQPTTAQGSAP